MSYITEEKTCKKKELYFKILKKKRLFERKSYVERRDFLKIVTSKNKTIFENEELLSFESDIKKRVLFNQKIPSKGRVEWKKSLIEKEDLYQKGRARLKRKSSIREKEHFLKGKSFVKREKSWIERGELY